MAIEIKKDESSENGFINIDINNGDLKALEDIVANWNFRDIQSALRFSIAVLKVTKPNTLLQVKESGNMAAMIPTDQLQILRIKMATTPINSQSNDFVPEDLIKQTEEHAKGITDLTARVICLEDKFGNNEKIADTLNVTLEKTVVMQNALSQHFIKLLKNAITETVKKVDREALHVLFKRFGFGGWTVLVAVTSALLIELVKNFYKDFFNTSNKLSIKQDFLELTY